MTELKAFHSSGDLKLTILISISLALVRDVQHRVSADMGVAFWDWHGRMGGDCSADRLATRGEPFMLRDRVHFSSAGADWIGGMLHADLMTAYEAWSAQRRGDE